MSLSRTLSIVAGFLSLAALFSGPLDAGAGDEFVGVFFAGATGVGIVSSRLISRFDGTPITLDLTIGRAVNPQTRSKLWASENGAYAVAALLVIVLVLIALAAVEASIYVAALDRALHQSAKRFMNLGVGRFEYLLWVADERIQHRSNDMLRLHSVNEQQQPGS